MESRPHPEQGFQLLSGIMRLADPYSPIGWKRPVPGADHQGRIAYKSVKSILKNGLDQQPLLFEQADKDSPTPHPQQHPGQKHYYERRDTMLIEQTTKSSTP